MKFIRLSGPRFDTISKGVLASLPPPGPGVFSSSNFHDFLAKYTFTTGRTEHARTKRHESVFQSQIKGLFF